MDPVLVSGVDGAQWTSTSDAHGWRPTRALGRAVGAGAALLLFAVLLRRVDLVVLALPLLLGTAIGLATRPRAPVSVLLSVPPAELLEGGPVTAVVRVRTPDRVDLVDVGLTLPPEVLADGVPLSALAGVVGELAPVRFPLRSMRWGRRTLGPATVRAVGAYGLLQAGPVHSRAVRITTWPLREDFVATDAMPWAGGMVGLHRSRRPGEGSDFAGVRPFAPGDRLRRINWRVTQRTMVVHVTQTYSDRDADVVLCLDTRHDMGVPPASSLDTTVRAAGAIAQHYLRHGDRVGLVDLGRALAGVPPGNGRAHLVRILDLLLEVRATGRTDTSAKFADRVASSDVSRLVPHRALVVVLTPLAGADAFAAAAALGRSGRPVVVLDTLPAGARPELTGPWTELAYRLWLLEREASIARLGELGLAVVPWVGAGSLDQVLRDVSRAAAAPRVSR